MSYRDDVLILDLRLPSEGGSASGPRRARPLRLGCLAVVTAVAIAGGCGGPPPVKKVTNPDPSGKIPAIKAAVEKGDRSVMAALVKDLNNDDPAVRFYAIEGLRRMTGETFEYRYYDDDDERQPAIKRWQEWLAKQ